MNLTVNNESKYAIVWMNNVEKDDPEMMKSLQPLIEECKEKKYRLVIFESGKKDLVAKTTDLLIHNRGLERAENEDVTILPGQVAR